MRTEPEQRDPRAFNDNGGRKTHGHVHSRILVALQDPEARRWMSRLLRARGFRVIALDEPSAVWSMVAEHATPCLSGFDFVICGAFREDRKQDFSRAPRPGTRFFLLLGRRGFVPFAANGTLPPAWAFRRAGMGPVQDDPTPPPSARHLGSLPCATRTVPGQA
jgi:hypothetical protein